MIRPPAPPPLPKQKVSPGHVKRDHKRWSRPRTYRREFMRTHPGLADDLLKVERRKARSLMWSRRLLALAMVAAVVAGWFWLKGWM